MPSFADSLTPEQRWAITDFIVSLSGSNGPGYTNLVIARHVDDPIDLAKGAASFASAPEARFPIIGQITEPVREFHPPTTSVVVQAIYDADSIALLVRWHDRTAEKTGTNGPSLTVPPEEEEEPAAAAPGEAQPAGGSPFGDQEVAPGGEQKAAANPFEEEAAPAATASEFSDAVSIQIPSQTPTGARKPYFIFGDTQNSVDLWFFDLARPKPHAVHRQGKRGYRAQRHGRYHRCRELRSGRVVGHLQAAPSRQPRAPRSLPANFCPSRSRCGTGSRASVAIGEGSRCGTPSTSSPKTSPRPLAR